MKLRDLVAQMARDQGWKARDEDGNPGLEVPLNGGRTQFVRVSEFTEAGIRGIRFTTRIGKVAGLGESRFKAALEVNMRLPHGCLAVDGDHMVLTEARRADAAAGSAEAVGFLARQADAYERLIFGSDTH
jgi:hypothetical protein